MSDHKRDPEDALKTTRTRREFIRQAATGTAILALGGGLYALRDDLTREARAEKLPDGRPRVPPGQRVLSKLRPMGGQPGDSARDKWTMRVHGEVNKELSLSFEDLMALPQTTQVSDVHCVTGWSVLDAQWVGVQVKHLAALAGVKEGVRHVIFEAAHGYTANVPFREATRDNVLVTHTLDDRPLQVRHGTPVRGLVPDLYFWKSAKWLTGIRFVTRDQPGYWETRGYHNHADPWREERYG
jgi:DMSO/TMAO reductase YedYZ molybdopterin-dependent catalytic subunit